jgi:hypothetical protein
VAVGGGSSDPWEGFIMTFDAVDFLKGLFRTTGRCDNRTAPKTLLEVVKDSPVRKAAGLPSDWHFAWDERAAILEYDAGFSRERAEAMALTEVLERMKNAGICL